MSSDINADEQARIWDSWAPVFDRWHQDADPTTEVEFLQELAAGGPALEFGAGTGRVALTLAATGCPVTAVEISPMMAAELEKKRDGEPVDVIVADITTLSLGTTFRLVYCIYSTLWCLTDQDEQTACFERAAEHLTDDGRLVVETVVPTAYLVSQARQLTLRGFDASSVGVSATNVNTATQRVSYQEITLRADGTELLPVEGRYCYPSEMDLMARIAGLRLECRFADFTRGVFGRKSPGHVSVYRRT